jgi:hypothetical protein
MSFCTIYLSFLVDSIGLTFAGDTSGIITKGIGPRPTAKDLHEIPFGVNESTYEQNNHE